MPATRLPMTWIVVADGARVRVFRHGAGRLTAVPGLAVETRAARNRELVTDRPGRVYSRMRGVPSAVEDGAGAHREEKRRFVVRLAATLAEAEAEGRFARLVLMAPPRVLGELRRAMPTSLRRRVDAEVRKDLTHAAPADILAHVPGTLRARHVAAAPRARAAAQPRKPRATK